MIPRSDDGTRLVLRLLLCSPGLADVPRVERAANSALGFRCHQLAFASALSCSAVWRNRRLCAGVPQKRPTPHIQRVKYAAPKLLPLPKHAGAADSQDTSPHRCTTKLAQECCLVRMMRMLTTAGSVWQYRLGVLSLNVALLQAFTSLGSWATTMRLSA